MTKIHTSQYHVVYQLVTFGGQYHTIHCGVDNNHESFDIVGFYLDFLGIFGLPSRKLFTYYQGKF